MNESSETEISPNERQTRKSSTLWGAKEWKPALVVVGVVVLLFIILSAFASRSLPGDSLYGMKVGVVEKLVASFKVGASEEAYRLFLLERRLSELQGLAGAESVSDGARSDISTSIVSLLTAETEMHIGSTTGGTVRADALRRLNAAASVGSAMETIAESTPQLESIGDVLEEARQEVVGRYKDEVTFFVDSESKETVDTFLKDLLALVSAEIASSGLSEERLRDTQVSLSKVGSALTRGDIERAIVSAGEAFRFIKLEKYLGVNFGETTSDATEEVETATTTVPARTSTTTATSSSATSTR